jgi:ribosomal protein L11 methyltransferase
MDPEVTGVRSRDYTLEAAETIALTIYVDTSAADDTAQRLVAEGLRLADSLGLQVTVQTEVHRGDAWRDSWKEFYRPLVFGSRLLVRPSWIERRPDDPALELVIDPGRAFGTGLHTTTALCLERLCMLAAGGISPRRVLDLGCGSGILTLACARLWPSARLVAIDTDPEAVATTEENAALNCIESLEVRTGDLAIASGSFDLVVANIRTQALVPIAFELLQRTEPGARATLSGVFEAEVFEVQRAYTEAGWKPDEGFGPAVRTEGSWHALDWIHP